MAGRILRLGNFVGKGVAAGVIGEVAVHILAPVFASSAYRIVIKAIWAMLGI